MGGKKQVAVKALNRKIDNFCIPPNLLEFNDY